MQKKIRKKIYFFLFLIFLAAINISAIGNTFFYYFYTDDFPLLYYIQNNIKYPWPYHYDTATYSIIYKFFTTSTYPYFAIGIITYFLASLAVYFFIKLLTKNNFIAFFSSAIFSTAYIGIDQFTMMSVSTMNNLNIINVCLTLILLIKWLDSGRLKYYFAAIAMFAISIFYIPYRAFPLIIFVPITEIIIKFKIETWEKMTRRSIFLVMSLIPFVILAYFSGIFSYGEVENTLKAHKGSIDSFIINNASIFFDIHILKQIFAVLGKFILLNSLHNPLFGIAPESIYFFTGLVFAGITISIVLFFSIKKHNARLSRSLFLMLLLTITSYIGIIRLLPNFDTNGIVNRYLTISFIGYSAIFPLIIYMFFSFFFKKTNERKLQMVTCLLILPFIIILIVSSRKYTQNIMEQRGNPARKFYDSLQSYVPRISDETVFYFDRTDYPPILANYEHILIGAFRSKDTNLAVFYKSYVKNIKIIDSFNDFVNEVKNNKNITYHSFYYDENGLTETTKDFKKHLLNKRAIKLSTNDIIYGKDIFYPKAEIPLKDISSIVPVEVSIDINITPVDFSLVSFPFFIDSLVSDENKKEIKNYYANIQKDHYFNYLLSRKKYYDTVKADVSSSHVSGMNKAENAIDDKIDTLWLSDESSWQVDKDSWIKIDLGEERKISKIIILDISRNRNPKDIKIFVSADKNYWQQIKNINNEELSLPDRYIKVISFLPIQARYLQMNIYETQGNLTPGISEIEIVEEQFKDINIEKALHIKDNLFEYIKDGRQWDAEYEYIQKNAILQVLTTTNRDVSSNNQYKLKIPVYVDEQNHQYEFIIPPRGTRLEKIELVLGFPANLKIEQMNFK